MSELGQYHINDRVIEHEGSLTRALSLKGTLGDIRTQEAKYLQKAKVPVFISEEQIPSGCGSLVRRLGAESGPLLTGSVEKSTEITRRDGRSLTSDWGKAAENLALNVPMF